MEVRFQNKVLFEIVEEDGRRIIKKEDKDASKKAGKQIYATISLDELVNSNRERINIK